MNSSRSIETRLYGLSAARRSLVLEMIDALSRDVRADINPSSDICTPDFALNFQDRLALYHAMNDEPLKKKTFEYAFAGASRAAGRTAIIDNNPVNPGTDVVVDGVSFSLKTEASQGIDRSAITISKLMEARWIRECHTGRDFVRGTRDRICGHLSQYQRIITLRAFSINEPNRAIEYHMIEIPLSLLLKIRDLKAQDFSSRTANGSSRADVFDPQGHKLFSLRLDGSVEKITISNLNVSNCVRHGSWIFDLSPTAD